MLIKLERYFKYPDLKRQTPQSNMRWGEFVFTEENVADCDYLVILDFPKEDFTINVKRKNIMHLCLEPPNEVSKYRQYANKQASIIYNQLNIRKNNVLSHGALPWHIDKDYDFLNSLKAESLTKENKIVWVTSNQRSSKGHNVRMNFLDKIKDLQFVDLYGRGIKPIDDKWDVLSSSKYAIAYENFQNDYYWTEKIVDCFLSYTMPLYFGCNKIEDFFPKNSFIQLDPTDKHIDLFLKEIAQSNKWEESFEALIEARNLALKEYQLFPFLCKKITDLEQLNKKVDLSKKELVHFKGGDKYFDNYPFSVKLDKDFNKIIRRLKK